MKVYEFICIWCTEHNVGYSTKIFSTLEKAKVEFENEVDTDIQNCWTEAFNKDGALKEGYIMECTDTYFCIYRVGLYNKASTEISISEKEVY